MQFLRSYQRPLHGEPKYLATDPEAIGQLFLAPWKSTGDWKLEIYSAGSWGRPAFYPASLSLLQTAGAAVFDVEMSPVFPLWHALQPLLPNIIIIIDAHNLMASQLWDLSCSHWGFWCAFEAGKLFETGCTTVEKKKELASESLYCGVAVYSTCVNTGSISFTVPMCIPIRTSDKQYNHQLDFFSTHY